MHNVKKNLTKMKVLQIMWHWKNKKNGLELKTNRKLNILILKIIKKNRMENYNFKF